MCVYFVWVGAGVSIVVVSKQMSSFWKLSSKKKMNSLFLVIQIFTYILCMSEDLINIIEKINF